MNKQDKYLFKVALVLFLMASFTLLTACTGRQGDTGAQGQQGIPGISPQAPTVSTQPTPTGVCLNGGVEILVNNTVSAVVCNGDNGANGTNGTNGTVITPVQFCPGFIQTYPSTFAESGICIGGNMYGVYSENGGFLALLPPGQYSSDGINASCTFTLEANCVIAQ